MSIRIVYNYIDDESGAKITAYVPTPKAMSEGVKIDFQGHAVVGFHTPMGEIERPVGFDIEAETIEEAFEKFELTKQEKVPQIAKEMIEEMKKQAQEHQERERSKIIVPGAMPPPFQG